MPESEREAVRDAAAAFRRAHAAFAVARPPVAVWRCVEVLFDRIAGLLQPHAVDEDRVIVGQVREFPGRGQALVPAIARTVDTDTEVVATVRLEPFYRGKGAAHGGVLPLLFDEVMGQLANVGRPHSRTAYLHVNYRSVTPIGVDLALAARVDRVEGRKVFVVASLCAGEALCADAEGLFVMLRPGQP